MVFTLREVNSMPGMVTSVVVGGKWQSGTEETNDQSRRKKNTGKKSKKKKG